MNWDAVIEYLREQSQAKALQATSPNSHYPNPDAASLRIEAKVMGLIADALEAGKTQ